MQIKISDELLSYIFLFLGIESTEVLKLDFQHIPDNTVNINSFYIFGTAF